MHVRIWKCNRCSIGWSLPGTHSHSGTTSSGFQSWLLAGICVSLICVLFAALEAAGHSVRELIDAFFSLADTLTLVDNVRRSSTHPADPKEEEVKGLWQKVRLQLRSLAAPFECWA